MEYRQLGTTGIKVSRLCFGSLTVGPLQANLPLRESTRVLCHALELGVNFIDTAQIYRTYPIIREVIKNGFKDVVICSKSYDYTREGMEKTLKEALSAIGRDYIDIFMLHEQESASTIKGHWEAVEYLLKARRAGLVRAVGISTHSVEAVRAAALTPELDVIQSIINKEGLGIRDGSVSDMRQAISFASSVGKGIYGMKALGGGHLLAEKNKALAYVLSIEELSSVAVGMQSLNEVEYNVRFFSGQAITPALEESLQKKRRRLHIEDWCLGCGRCVERCTAGALSLIEGKVRVNQFLCRLCGYCGSVCPEFCIKII